MTKTFLIIVVVLGFVNESLASRYVGNGGFTVKCSIPGGGSRIELLDFWEARQLNSRYMTSFSKNESLVESIDRTLRDLSKAAPRLGGFLREQLPYLVSEATYTHDYSLFDTDDVGTMTVRLPSECELRQIADHVFVPFGETGRLTIIDDDAFNSLPREDRAGLLLHELMYGLFDAPIESSRDLRRFVAFLASRDLSRLSKVEILRALHDFGFEDDAPLR